MPGGGKLKTGGGLDGGILILTPIGGCAFICIGGGTFCCIIGGGIIPPGPGGINAGRFHCRSFVSRLI